MLVLRYTDQRKHFNRQLPLEAAIAEAGGFRDIAAAEVDGISYLGLGRSLKIAETRKSAEPDFVETSIAALIRMLGHFDLRSHGYMSRRAPYREEFPGDYDHLARYGELDASADPVPEDVG